MKRTRPKKIPEEVQAMFGEERLRMKLDTFDGQAVVAQCHHRSIVECPGGGFQLGWQGQGIDDQRVIARDRKWRRQALEKAFSIVGNVGKIAVHGSWSADDAGRESVGNDLVAKANAQDWQTASPAFQKPQGIGCLFRLARSG